MSIGGSAWSGLRADGGRAELQSERDARNVRSGNLRQQRQKDLKTKTVPVKPSTNSKDGTNAGGREEEEGKEAEQSEVMRTRGRI